MTINDTVDILNTYRDRLKAQYEKPGWNKWALFGALASLLWLLIDMLAESNLETKDSPKFLISLILFEMVIGQFQATVNLSGNGKTKYIEFKKEVPTRLLNLAFQFVIFSLILVYSHAYLIFPNAICSFIYFGFLYFNLIITLLIPLVIKIGFPFPQGPIVHKKGRWITNFFLGAIILFTIFSGYFVTLTIDNWKIYSMWKSAFIFFGLYFIVAKIIETIQKNPLIDEINNLIDEVVFGKINPETAISNLKLIVVGLELKDAISPLLIEYFDIEKSIRDKVVYINQIVNKVKEETDEVKKKALIEAINGNIKYFKENEYLGLTEFTKKIGMRLVIYKTFDHDSNEMKQTIEQISSSIKDLEAQMQVTQHVIDELNNKIKS